MCVQNQTVPTKKEKKISVCAKLKFPSDASVEATETFTSKLAGKFRFHPEEEEKDDSFFVFVYFLTKAFLD